MTFFISESIPVQIPDQPILIKASDILLLFYVLSWEGDPFCMIVLISAKLGN